MEQEGEWADYAQIIEATLVEDLDACKKYFEQYFERGKKCFGVGKGPGLVEKPQQHITCTPVQIVNRNAAFCSHTLIICMIIASYVLISNK
eukprot:491641-Rhodomonas_salina.2